MPLPDCLSSAWCPKPLALACAGLVSRRAGSGSLLCRHDTHKLESEVRATLQSLATRLNAAGLEYCLFTDGLGSVYVCGK